MQKLVRGATKPKATAPKAKYIEPILASTYEAGHDFETVMDQLARVIHGRNGPWPSIYKALIVIHIMIREGSEDVTLEYLANHPRVLDVEDYVHRAPAMGRYSRYLSIRAQQFKETEIDYVRYKTRTGFSRLHKLTVAKGLIRECGSVVIQLDALMKCQYQEQDIENDDVLLMAFRLLVHDALSLFQVLNEGVINILEHFFELSKEDAEQALDLYRGFRRVTSKVIQYLRTAKDFEFKTMLHVPNIKHAPTSLVSSLEMYLNDPEFESNRQKYLAEKDAHKRNRPSGQGQTVKSPISTSPDVHNPFWQQTPTPVAPTTPVAPATGTTGTPTVSTVGAPSIQPVPMHMQQTQQEASNIQTTDGQAQIQMQQLRQLQMQQIEQQERIKQQIQQLEQQKQQQLNQQQLNQQLTQQQYNQQVDFDFGFSQQPVQLQPQLTQPAPTIQPVQAQPQAQATAEEYNPFKRANSMHYQQPAQIIPTNTGNAPMAAAPLTGVPTGPTGVPTGGMNVQPITGMQPVTSSAPTLPPISGINGPVNAPVNGPVSPNGHNPFSQSHLIDLGNQRETNPFRL